MPPAKILLVEGKDDEIVLRKICKTRNIPEPEKIEQLGGVEPLLEDFPVRLKESGIEVLGVGD